ncbi:MAG: hypothetical protein HOM20_09145 [Porticoccaceae bacterium]|jgi:hypothetical protein|nr:hypothetical protein [Porticoccaceae bacterium]MBT6594298.1 hypothetical protein [Porticoccaceae bacterium]MDG1495913.1 hypothetical protein [Porticoccaceae bacterium]
MTEIATGELFTASGPSGAVEVVAVPDAIVFVPVAEPEMRVRYSIVNSDTANSSVTAPESIRLSYEGIFSARIAKVKRKTADIFKQLKNLHFADQ